MGKLADEIYDEMEEERGSKGASDEDDTDDADDSETEDYASDEEAIMREFMDADDAAGKAAALKSFIKVCTSKE